MSKWVGGFTQASAHVPHSGNHRPITAQPVNSYLGVSPFRQSHQRLLPTPHTSGPAGTDRGQQHGDSQPNQVKMLHSIPTFPTTCPSYGCAIAKTCSDLITLALGAPTTLPALTLKPHSHGHQTFSCEMDTKMPLAH